MISGMEPPQLRMAAGIFASVESVLLASLLINRAIMTALLARSTRERIEQLTYLGKPSRTASAGALVCALGLGASLACLFLPNDYLAIAGSLAQLLMALSLLLVARVWLNLHSILSRI